MARARGGSWVWTRTDDDGMARIWGLGDGPVEVSAAGTTGVPVPTHIHIRLRRWPGSD
jgi:hypothetical protein